MASRHNSPDLFEKPVAIIDHDETLTDTTSPDVLAEYGSVWFRMLASRTHITENELRDIHQEVNPDIGSADFSLDGRVVAVASDAYAIHTYYGHAILRELGVRHPSSSYLPYSITECDRVLSDMFRECKRRVVVPYRPDAYDFLKYLLHEHEKDNLFLAIASSSAPETIRHENLPKLDEGIAECINIYQWLKHKVAKGSDFSSTPDGTPIPEAAQYRRWPETLLRRPDVYAGMMQIQRDAHDLQPGEVIDLRRTKTIVLGDSIDLDLSLADHLGATTILLATLPGLAGRALSTWLQIFNERGADSSSRHIVRSLSSALFVIYEEAGITPNLKAIDTFLLLLDAIAAEEWGAPGLQASLIKMTEERQDLIVEGSALQLALGIHRPGFHIHGRDSYPADAIGRRRVNGASVPTLYSDLTQINQHSS